MKTPLLAIALVAVQAAGTALAQNPITSGETVRCFARAYDTDHLAEHSGQRVVEMTVVMHRFDPTESEEAGVIVRAMVRDRFGEFFANAGSCREDGPGVFSCGIECDGGRFGVAIADDGTAMLRNEDWGFVLYGGCGEEVAENREVIIQADAEHRAFRLYPLPLEACPVDLWQTYDDWSSESGE